MSLTPDEIADKDFVVGLRGYDKDEVRSFLHTVADAFRSAATPVEVAPSDDEASKAAPAGTDWANLGEEIAAVLRTAHEQAATLRTDAENEVKALRQKAESDATTTRFEADAHAEAVKAEAEQARDEAAKRLTAAQDEALTLVSDAQDRVEKMLEASKLRAKEEAAASIAHLTAQIDELAATRDAARSSLADLRGRLDLAIENAEQPLPMAVNGDSAVTA